MSRRTHVCIVGAGFSKYAGLPLQSDFTEALLALRSDNSHPMRPLVARLGEFIGSAFGHRESAKAKHWANLEDLFTNIDLVANTGHHLAAAYSPSKLRTTRRILLSGMMSMLNERYLKAESDKGMSGTNLDKFFKKLDLDHSAFVSINWDTVI